MSNTHQQYAALADGHYDPAFKKKFLKPETREAVLARIAELEREMEAAQAFIDQLKQLL